MSALRKELHELVDQLPYERLALVLALVREGTALGRRAKAVATPERVREWMRGMTGVDEKLDRLPYRTRGSSVNVFHRAHAALLVAS